MDNLTAYLDELDKLRSEWSTFRRALIPRVPKPDLSDIKRHSCVLGFQLSTFIIDRITNGKSPIMYISLALTVGMILHAIRKYTRLYYGVLELILSGFISYYAFNNISYLTVEIAAFVSSVYLVVRGIDNMSQGYDERFKEDNEGISQETDQHRKVPVDKLTSPPALLSVLFMVKSWTVANPTACAERTAL